MQRAKSARPSTRLAPMPNSQSTSMDALPEVTEEEESVAAAAAQARAKGPSKMIREWDTEEPLGETLLRSKAAKGFAEAKQRKPYPPEPQEESLLPKLPTSMVGKQQNNEATNAQKVPLAPAPEKTVFPPLLTSMVGQQPKKSKTPVAEWREEVKNTSAGVDQ